MKKYCTIFCDIDGTLFSYRTFSKYKTTDPTPIKNTITQINKSYDDGHHIVLTTARPEYLRIHTMNELNKTNIRYHKLVMAIGRGPRILINDNESSAPEIDRAFAINVKRNEGFTDEQNKLFCSITDN